MYYSNDQRCGLLLSIVSHFEPVIAHWVTSKVILIFSLLAINNINATKV